MYPTVDSQTTNLPIWTGFMISSDRPCLENFPTQFRCNHAAMHRDLHQPSVSRIPQKRGSPRDMGLRRTDLHEHSWTRMTELAHVAKWKSRGWLSLIREGGVAEIWMCEKIASPEHRIPSAAFENRLTSSDLKISVQIQACCFAAAHNQESDQRSRGGKKAEKANRNRKKLGAINVTNFQQLDQPNQLPQPNSQQSQFKLSAPCVRIS